MESNQPDMIKTFTGRNVIYMLAGCFFLFLGILVIFPHLNIPVLRIVLSALTTVDFIAHEFGHVIFGFMGKFMGVLGGTLAQLFLPVVCLYLSYRRRKWFNLSLFAFWTGQSLTQISAYVRDAQTQALELFSPWSLLGGGKAIHDWHYLLTESGLLWADQFLGWAVYFSGLGLILLSAGIMFLKAVETPETNDYPHPR